MGRAEENAARVDSDGPAVRQNRHGDGRHADILDHPKRRISQQDDRRGSGARIREPTVIVGPVEDPSPPVGRVVAMRAAPGDTVAAGPRRVKRGPLTVCLVVDGLPVGDLPAGARLRIGGAVVVELRTPAAGCQSGAHAAGGGLLEAGETDVVRVEVLEGGLLEPGAVVTLEAVALPLTDVLDLHSFRPEDTPRVVSEYLAEAQRAGLGEVRLVHGRGRGVQRAAVRRLLAEAPGVAGFADAPPTRGGWGATIVRLRQTEDAPSE
jgi:hypothetical protein